MRISDWSSDVCSSDLRLAKRRGRHAQIGGNSETGLDDDFGTLQVAVDAYIPHQRNSAHALQHRLRRIIQLHRIIARQHDGDIAAGTAALRLETDPRAGDRLQQRRRLAFAFNRSPVSLARLLSSEWRSAGEESVRPCRSGGSPK